MNEKKTILIIEDEIINIEIYRELLEDIYILKIAENGAQAIYIMKSDPPDIILLDMMLPDISGIDLCLQFKKNETTSYIPIIIVTTLQNKKYKIQGLKAGANDYLFKPIDEEELLLKVKNHLMTKDLRDQLNTSFQNIVKINDISASLMNNFDPSSFDYNTNLSILINDYSNLMKDRDRLPSYIMTSVKIRNNSLDSTLYKLDKNELKLIKTNILINNYQKYAIRKGIIAGDVSFQNRNKDDKDFIDFQQRFHKEVKKRVGKIYNYISYHGNNIFITAFNYKNPVTRTMAQTFKSFALHGNFFKVIHDQLDDVKEAFTYTLNSLARAAEASDKQTGAHIIRINHYSGFIAKQLNLPDRQVKDIFNSAQMHDIGKIHIHPNILLKPGKLNDEEWSEMKQHPAYGAKILGNSDFMGVAKNVCLYHHENSDGSGYPRGLKNEQTPIEARIVHLADVYDSLRSARSYKPEFSHEKAISIIIYGDGRTKPEHFDPDILEIFKKSHIKFDDIYKKLTNITD